MCSPCCPPCCPEPCCPPCPEPNCCPTLCAPCCPTPCFPPCPSPCGPCPSPCGPCPDPCGPCPSPCGPCCPPPCDPLCPCPCGPCCPPKRCRSRELRGGSLITNCECIKRNGLQLDCPRSECRGRPLCTSKPIPCCCPSKYMWRYANVTMGKPSFPAGSNSKCPPKCGCCEF